ncbi:MAG: nucleotidyl transferase AbiEii/AbiGii toxin family protein [Vicinamibacteraceae bacterium]
MILGGQLERGSSLAKGPRFTIKGAVALEMRLPLKARATRDIDLVVDDLDDGTACRRRDAERAIQRPRRSSAHARAHK